MRRNSSCEERTIQKILQAILSKHQLPALVVGILLNKTERLLMRAIGARIVHSNEQVSVSDKFHIGSCTKSMTATLAAMLVEKKVLSWKTTLSDVFMTPRSRILPVYRCVTLEQLLIHSGGFPTNIESALWDDLWHYKGTPSQQRTFLVENLLSMEPIYLPGTKCVYSNSNFVVAAAMLEKATQRSWEDLIIDILFKPLEMYSAGFGAPATIGKVDQPWGHLVVDDHIKPVEPGLNADNPLGIAPAGGIHCSIKDLAKYARFHLDGSSKHSISLSADAFKKLHGLLPECPIPMGWILTHRSWSKGPILTHSGSNTMFYTSMWLALEEGFAIFVSTNIGSKKAQQACDETVGHILQCFFPYLLDL